MNRDLLIVGIICLVAGVMGYLYASDQADGYYLNTFLYGHSGPFDQTTYRTGSYLFAGLATLGAALTAAGIFSSPVPEPGHHEDSRPREPIDTSRKTRDEMRLKFLKYGAALFLAGVGGFFLIPGTFKYVGQLIAIVGFMLMALYLALY